jgi:hypothetical protein
MHAPECRRPDNRPPQKATRFLTPPPSLWRAASLCELGQSRPSRRWPEQCIWATGVSRAFQIVHHMAQCRGRMQCQIVLPRRWIDATALEAAIRAGGNPHGQGVYTVLIRFPSGCKLMIDAAIRLLSLSNQLAFSTRRIRLEFEEGQGALMGYLNRMGFFDHLASSVEVSPARPSYSGASRYRGANADLVEIARINKDHRDKNLPSHLTQALMRSCHGRSDAGALENAAWTIFAELIDNVFSHSQTPLDGYAALQSYRGGNRLAVAVSDNH